MNRGNYKILLAGTKNGWVKFYSSKEVFLTDDDLPDLRDLLNINVADYGSGKVFFSIEYIKNNLLISVYRAIKDWYGRDGGHYAISLVLDSAKDIVYEDIVAFLKQLSDLYWDKYIIKNGEQRFQITKSTEDFDFFEWTIEQYLSSHKNENDVGKRIVTDGDKESNIQTVFHDINTDLRIALSNLTTNRNSIKRIFFIDASRNEINCSYRKVPIDDILNIRNREIYKQDYAPPQPSVKTPAPKPGEVKKTPGYNPPRGEQEKRKPRPQQQKAKAKAPSKRARPNRKRVVLHLFIVLVGIILIGAMIGYYLNEGSAFSKEELQQELKVYGDLTTEASDEKLLKAKKSIDSICSLFREEYSTKTGEINSICSVHLNKVKNLLEKKQVEQLNENIKELVTSTKFDVAETEELQNLGKEKVAQYQIAQLEEYLEIAKTVKDAKKYIYMDITGNTNILNFNKHHYKSAEATKNKLRGYYSPDNEPSMLKLSDEQTKDLELFHDLLRNKLNAVLEPSQLFEYIRDVLVTKDQSYQASRYKELARFYNVHKPDTVSKVKEKY